MAWTLPRCFGHSEQLILVSQATKQTGEFYPSDPLTLRSAILHFHPADSRRMRGKFFPLNFLHALYIFYSCLLATLSSNMDLTVWASGKNYLKGEWSNVGRFKFPFAVFLTISQICDATAFLLTTHAVNNDAFNVTAQALKSQVTCKFFFRITVLGS